jgi:hypothetical protein
MWPQLFCARALVLLRPTGVWAFATDTFLAAMPEKEGGGGGGGNGAGHETLLRLTLIAARAHTLGRCHAHQVLLLDDPSNLGPVTLMPAALVLGVLADPRQGQRAPLLASRLDAILASCDHMLVCSPAYKTVQNSGLSSRQRQSFPWLMSGATAS